ncbi:MOSC domain-containing protein [Shimia abyssi]|uniref:MOSC domain-containing protein n=1 Tax=Shimia abyssi TaxID=1662395 RepID=A0A2P8FE20_9RHOB|nr:MOSC domain-containing protein [Shimia abyssi]PSL19961.1 hypothetical protein CLV88_10419 [Shimia abyssi]
MPALKPTRFFGEITWLGCVADSDVDLSAVAREALTLRFAGPEGEGHAGMTRKSCSRVLAQHPRGTEIANARQLSVLSQEEVDAIGAAIGLEALSPAMMGASLVVRGIPDFTHVLPGSRLQGEDGATIVIDMENRPCVLPGRVIEGAHPGHGAAFKAAAKDRRGVTAWVEREGVFRLGQRLRLHVPDQPVWAHLDVARAG